MVAMRWALALSTLACVIAIAIGASSDTAEYNYHLFSTEDRPPLERQDLDRHGNLRVFRSGLTDTQLPGLGMDSARIRIVYQLLANSNQSYVPLNIQLQSAECFECDLWTVTKSHIFGYQVGPNSSCGIIDVQANYEEILRINGVNLTFAYGDRGVYNLTVFSNGTYLQVVDVEPASIALPLITAAVVVAACLVVFNLGSSEISKRCTAKSEREPLAPGAVPPVTSSVKPRFRSVDAFRGGCLSLMIFVNYGGGYFAFLSHAAWDGLNVADEVFPLFIFVMGIGIAIVLNNSFKRKESRLAVTLRALRRSATLCALGIFLSTNNTSDGCDFVKLRIPGVLQRFGVSFLPVVVVAYCIPTVSIPKRMYNREPSAGTGSPTQCVVEPIGATLNTVAEPAQPRAFWGAALHILRIEVLDIFSLICQWSAVLMLHALWYYVTYVHSAPGCPAGYTGPGGIGNHGHYSNCTGGIARYIDSKVFGENHIYRWPTCAGMYGTKRAFDPEGLLGSLNSVFLCFLGYVGGRILIHSRTNEERFSRWALYAIVFGVLGGSLCGWKRFGGPIPPNKNLWSPTFVYIMAFQGYVLMAIIYWVVDVKRWTDGAPFSVMGMNSITVYIMADLLGQFFPFSVYGPTNHWFALFSNIMGVGANMVIAYWMHRRKLYIAV